MDNQIYKNNEDIINIQTAINNIIDNFEAIKRSYQNRFNELQNEYQNNTTTFSEYINSTTTLFNSLREQFQQLYQDVYENINGQEGYKALLNAYEETFIDIKDQIGESQNQVQNNAQEITRIQGQLSDSLNTLVANLESYKSTMAATIDDINRNLADIQVNPDYLGLYQNPDTYLVYPTFKGNVSNQGIYLIGTGGGSGGGGGNVVNNVTMKATRTPGWWGSKSISADDQHCEISVNWFSIDESAPDDLFNGTLQLIVNRQNKLIQQVQQGDVVIDIRKYLQTGKINTIDVLITDAFNNVGQVHFTVTIYELKITSTFNANRIYDTSGNILFYYTLYGGTTDEDHIVHFELDGVQEVQNQAGRINQILQKDLGDLSHGGHTLKVYFQTEINGKMENSNELYYEFIRIKNSDDIVIASSFNQTQIEQFNTIILKYQVYDPKRFSVPVIITTKIDNGQEQQIFTGSVDREEKTLSWQADTAGQMQIKIIVSGAQPKIINILVTPTTVTDNIEATTQGLRLYLTSKLRSNDADNRNLWNYENYSATLTGFNYQSDGWVRDEDGITCLRVAGQAKVVIPYYVFKENILNNGFSFEVEFATRNVANYDAIIMSCFSNNKGFKITPQSVLFQGGSNTKLNMQYKENQHIRICFTVELQPPAGSNNQGYRLMKAYINGVLQRVIQYGINEDFQHSGNNIGITIGAQNGDCTIDVYNIRIYSRELSMKQVVQNWIADMQNTKKLVEAWERNQIYNSNNKIMPGNLPNNLPILVLQAKKGLPNSKYRGEGDSPYPVSGYYIDNEHPANNFHFNRMAINVQGTTSEKYYRKNYDMKFKNDLGENDTLIAELGNLGNDGFEMDSTGHSDTFKLRSNSVPTDRFVIKADVASSESANNTQLVRYYNDICPYSFPQKAEDRTGGIRWGVDGFPVVVFWQDDSQPNSSLEFLGKYNFNFPKRFPNGYGYPKKNSDGTDNIDESWEFQNNRNKLMFFTTDQFSMQLTRDPENPQGEVKEAWKWDYEARFPKDTWDNLTQLQTFQSWVFSTYRNDPNMKDENEQYKLLENNQRKSYEVNSKQYLIDLYPDAQEQKYTIVENRDQNNTLINYTINFTHDTPAYRLTKFKVEFKDYAMQDSFIFYYIFTQLFAMVDSRAKNLFIGFHGDGNGHGDPNNYSPIDGIRRKAVAEPYDMDTAMGTNNEGNLTLEYNVEDTDVDPETHLPVFNAQDSVLWNNIRDSKENQIIGMYRSLRGVNLSYNDIETRYEEAQHKWPEMIWNEDAQRKYLDPLLPEKIDEPTTFYLSMCQGNKQQQRKQWLERRFAYFDSKWYGNQDKVIAIRTYLTSEDIQSGKANTDITITPYIDLYASFELGSTYIQEKTYAGQPKTITLPSDALLNLQSLNDTEFYIYSADWIRSIGDISSLMPDHVNISQATRLQEIILGKAGNYNFPTLKKLDLGTDNVTIPTLSLLKKIDVTNCTGLTASINASNCPMLEQAYFTGTNITSLSLPNGGVLKKLHLPSTITQLVIQNQQNIEEFSVIRRDRNENDKTIFVDTEADYSNIKYLDIRNIGESNIPLFAILDTIIEKYKTDVQNTPAGQQLPDRLKIQLEGFTQKIIAPTVEDAQDQVEEFFENLLLCQNLQGSMNGNNYVPPTIVGTIDLTQFNSINGQWLTEIQQNPNYSQFHVQFLFNNVNFQVTFHDGDGNVLPFSNEQDYYEVSGSSGSQISVTYTGSTPTKTSTAQFDYTFNNKWAIIQNGNPVQGVLNNITKNIDLYACFDPVRRSYPVYFKLAAEDNNGTERYLKNETTNENHMVMIPYGTTISAINDSYPYISTSYYPNTVQHPVSLKGTQQEGYGFIGWKNLPKTVTGLTNIYANFNSPVDISLIEDSWDTIIANIDNDTYKTAYKIGNYKPLDLGEYGTYNMQIAAFDSDKDTNNQTIPITFISMELVDRSTLPSSIANPEAYRTDVAYKGTTRTFDYSNSNARTALIDYLLPKIATVNNSLYSRLIAAKKTYRYIENGHLNEWYYDAAQGIVNDKLWVPSCRELSGHISSSQLRYYALETSGTIYSRLYEDSNNRIKTLNGIAHGYQIRTSYNSNGNSYIYGINSSGTLNGTGTNGSGIEDYIPFGFCLGREPETISASWETILADSNPSSHYSIGGTKYLNLGTEGNVLMEIVAFDADDKANNSGKAKITWLSKGLLNTQRTMGGTGWEDSTLRSNLDTVIKPLIPETVRNSIVAVTKYTNSATTSDELWVPNTKEVNYQYAVESSGPTYSSKFTDDASRIKKRRTGANESWWLRTANSSDRVWYVREMGAPYTTYLSSSLYVAFGFCTD